MSLDEDRYVNAVEHGLTRLHTTQAEVERHVAERDWLVWSCQVHRPSEYVEWIWSFRDDFTTSLPYWADLYVPPNGNVIYSMVVSRLPLDAGLCNYNSANAIASGKDGYSNAFRLRQRDGTDCWVEERVAIEWLDPNSMILVGVVRHGDDEVIARGIKALAEYDELTQDDAADQATNDLCELQRRFNSLKRDVRLLVRSGQWLIWAAEVHRVSQDPSRLDWTFRRDFVQILPDWLNVTRISNEDLAATLGRARLPEDDAACHDTAMQALLSGQTGYRQVFRVRRLDGSIGYVEENVTIQTLGPDSWHVVGVCIDATERKAAEDRLLTQNEALQTMQKELQNQNKELHRLQAILKEEKHALSIANERLSNLATTDGLTGAKNHRALREQLDTELKASARYLTPVSLIILDIDRFKRHNDEFGHLAGDAVLITVATILRETARECDFVARYGGEEFAIILPHTDRCGAYALAERFRANIERNEWTHRRITASFGVATTSIDCTTADELIGRADRALYRAKSSGRNCVVSHDPV